MKFEIGQTVYYVESAVRYGKSVPCEMCFGKRFVTIILGDDSKEKIECGYCISGFDPPSGIMTVWEPSSRITSGTISGLEQYGESWKYKVGFSTVEEYKLYESKEAAGPERLEKFKEVEEQSKKYFRDNFRNAKKSQVWSCGYHRNEIKRHKRQIEWHEMRLSMIKAKK